MTGEMPLPGCSPRPLASYLKALGVLRLLSKRDPELRAAWRGDVFRLRTVLTREQVENYFIYEYEPTPVMAPWNGGSGFYFQERKSKEKDSKTGAKLKLGVRDQATAATRIIDSVLESRNSRLACYRGALSKARVTVEQFAFVEAPENGRPKDELVRCLRGVLPDACLEWIDAALVVTAGSTKFPPLVGTGGNDGNLDFTSNFMQRLLETIGDGVEPPPYSADWLRSALFGLAVPGLTNSKIGQFSPGQAGGPNASTGFVGGATVNPWEFVLMIEGALTFAAAAVRRNAEDPGGILSYPFTVRPVGAGAGNLGGADATSARGELWMPLWDQLASYAEIRTLFAEGRVAFGRRAARDGLDFVRAVHCLGAYRGIAGFERYGLLMRAGKAYLATPLGRVETKSEPSVSLFDELDRSDWLAKFRAFAATAATRFRMLSRRLEDAVFQLSAHLPSAREVQLTLVLLGEIQAALAASSKASAEVRPVPVLSNAWMVAADDATPAFRIARALAALRGVGDRPLPLRAQLFPIHPCCSRWKAEVDKDKLVVFDPYRGVRVCTGTDGSLLPSLRTVGERRLWLGRRLEMADKPLGSAAGATLSDLAAFLQGAEMDERIEALLPGLSLCAIAGDPDHVAGEGTVPAAFGLLKLALTPDSVLRRLGAIGAEDHVPVPAGMLAQLGAGAGNRAVELAWRRLHVSGLNPVFRPDCLPALMGAPARRAAAALLIPLRFGAYRRLAQELLRPGEGGGA